MSDISIQAFTDQLRHIEKQIAALRLELRKQDPKIDIRAVPDDHVGVNKEALKRSAEELFQLLDIHGEAKGAETLQTQMLEAELAPNELSRSIVEARKGQ